MNQYFATISERLKIENHQEGPNFDPSKLNDYISGKIPESVEFSIPLMKLADLKLALKSLDVTKATGLDGITPKILKASAEVVSPVLLKIINISIQNGQFPDSLKQAKLKPIHKDGLKSDPSNYRPISVLPVLSKIRETLTKHLFGFFNKYDILHKSQSGFRKHHSCNTALISLLDKRYKNIDKGEITEAIFFDLRKALDVVDHEILLQKLQCHKFDNHSMHWIHSYLTNRRQCIIDKEFRSSMQEIRSGVPQGSVLGAVLFLLFINDIPLIINESYAEIYADDTTIHVAHKTQDIVETKLQNSAIDFKFWCIQHKMFVNWHKTSLMTIGTRQNLSNTFSMNISIDNESISNVSHQKLLGIIIDKTLSWDK